jgi:Rps23 Pro-64 3,4-dihydroxylase Tpa1-like proline 4-hydroxylase
VSAAFECAFADGLDPQLYADEYRRKGRIRITGFLREDCAQAIHAALVQRTPWNLTLIHDGARDITPAQWAALSDQQKAKLNQEVIEAARVRFEGRYCTHRLSQEGEAYQGGVPELAGLYKFLGSETCLSFMRAVTGEGGITFADGVATLYTPGDFLLEHDDEKDIAKRYAAYILNFCPRWRPEWGGLLCFPQGEGHTEDFVPGWNTLNLLRVPQPHFVSFVTPYASAGRYSVTGWMRGAQRMQMTG